ncbi:MAG: helix-turn-helix domain-containing protein [Chitinivibrionales bacterium]|nr:helix-turn-helix domain-containing protein [Chitinivibrionales bacterium]
MLRVLNMPRIGKQQIIRLQKKYNSDAKIGQLYGISRQAIYQLRCGYDLPPVKIKNHDRDRLIKQDFDQGTPVAAIAKKYKLSRMQIYRIIKKQDAPKSELSD